MYQYLLVFNTNKSPKNPYTMCVKLDFSVYFLLYFCFYSFFMFLVSKHIYIYINKITKALVGVEVAQGLLGGIVALEDASSFQDSSRRKEWERNKV